MSGIRVRAGEQQLSPSQKCWQRPLFDEPFPHKDSRQAPYLRLHQPGYHCFPHPFDSLIPCNTKLGSPPKLFPVPFPHKWPILAPASDSPKITQTSSIYSMLYLSPSGPTPRTSSSQLEFTAWLLLGTSKPSTSTSHP